MQDVGFASLETPDSGHSSGGSGVETVVVAGVVVVGVVTVVGCVVVGCVGCVTGANSQSLTSD